MKTENKAMVVFYLSFFIPYTVIACSTNMNISVIVVACFLWGMIASSVVLLIDKHYNVREIKGILSMDWDSVMCLDGKNLNDILPDDWKEGDLVEFTYRRLKKVEP